MDSKGIDRNFVSHTRNVSTLNYANALNYAIYAASVRYTFVFEFPESIQLFVATCINNSCIYNIISFYNMQQYSKMELTRYSTFLYKVIIIINC